MPGDLRVGVIGLGRMGIGFCRLIVQLPGIELGGVVDIDEQRARLVGKELDARVFLEVDDLLKHGIDGLVVATPEDAHVVPTVAALRAGVGVFVEKPLATTLRDARLISAAAHNSDAPVLVGHVSRFDPAYRSAKDQVKNGELGSVLYVYARRNTTPETLVQTQGRTSCLYYLGIHDVDLVQWILDSSVRQVFAKRVPGPLRGINTDAAVVSMLELEVGTLATLESSWLRHDGGASVQNTASMHIMGDRGTAEITPFISANVTHTDRGVTAQNQAYVESSSPTRIVGGLYMEEIIHFIRVMKGESRPMCSVNEALSSVAVIAAIERSLASGSTELVSDE